MKTSTEILEEIDKEKERVNKLREIRNERQKLKGEKIPQKRKVEIIEHENGKYSLVGFAWQLPLQKREVASAVKSWVDGSLENGVEIKF